MSVHWRSGGLMLVVTALLAVLGWGLWSLLAGTAHAADAHVECLRVQTPPPPPVGGAVFARALRDNVPGPNVVWIPGGQSWTAASCPAEQAAATRVVQHPESIMVGAGGAVLLTGDNLSSAWGARDVPLGAPPPDLTGKRFSGGPTWVPTEAQTLDQQTMLNIYDSCRGCSLANASITKTSDNAGTPPGEESTEAFKGSVQGADLRGAQLRGQFWWWDLSDADLSGANLSGVDLSAATLDHTIVSDTKFDDAVLAGTQLTSLRARVPPSLVGVKVGDDRGVCTAFKDTNLVDAKFTIGNTRPDRQCADSPLLPGSEASPDLIPSASRSQVNLAGTRFVVTAGNRRSLAGADLSGVKLGGAKVGGSSFIGYPIDLMKTNFDNASLAQTSFEQAHLAGATFHGADLSGASFQGADLADRGDVNGASFAGKETNLTNADFVESDVSGASFSGALLSGASFSHALAVNTDFSSVRAPAAEFNGAHIYGNGQAFHDANDLKAASFAGAVLAGSLDVGGGFDFTGADLTGAQFDRTQCVNCVFASAKLENANLTGAYLPGARFKGVGTMNGAKLFNAWLYCGNRANSKCDRIDGTSDRWAWPLALGSTESYGPVSFADTDIADLPADKLDDVNTCPDGKDGKTQPRGCAGAELPRDAADAPPLPAPCSSAAEDACPTRTSTELETARLGTPLAVASAVPVTWATTLSRSGVYAGFPDGTIRQVVNGTDTRIAGQPGKHCPASTDKCGDDGPAKDALLGQPSGLAVGLHGAVYVADPELHRVRRLEPDGKIVTIAGDGSACAVNNPDCGTDVPATQAKLEGPYGVWVNPRGQVFIADGDAGVRETHRDGTIHDVGAEIFGVRSVVGNGFGDLYAATASGIYEFTPGDRASVKRVVGTGTAGYNGDTDQFGNLRPGDKVMVDHPQGLTIGLNGGVLFSDTGNDLIRAYVPSSGHVINLAGSVVGGTPKAGFNGDGHWADQTELDHPLGVTPTRDGLFIAADSANKRLRRFGPVPLDERARTRSRHTSTVKAKP